MLERVKDWLSGVFDSVLGDGPPPYDPERAIFAGEDRDAEGGDYRFSFYQVPGPYSFKARLLSGSVQDEGVIAALRGLAPGQTMKIIKDPALPSDRWNMPVAGIKEVSAGTEYDIPNTDYLPLSLNLDEVRRVTAGSGPVAVSAGQSPSIK